MANFIKLLTDKGLEDLKKFAQGNLAIYANETLDKARFSTFEFTQCLLQNDTFPTLYDADDSISLWENDFRNSLLIYRFFAENEVPLTLLHDERLMAYITHFIYLDYMKKRWPIDDKHGDKRVLDRYFFRRAPYARNGILMLFWPAYLIAQVTELGNEELFEKKLRCFFENRVVLDRVLENNYSRNPAIFDMCVTSFLEWGDRADIVGHGRSRLLAKNINNVLAVTSLDAMSFDDGLAIIEGLFESIANGDFDNKASTSDDSEEEDEEE